MTDHPVVMAREFQLALSLVAAFSDPETTKARLEEIGRREAAVDERERVAAERHRTIKQEASDATAKLNQAGQKEQALIARERAVSATERDMRERANVEAGTAAELSAKLDGREAAVRAREQATAQIDAREQTVAARERLMNEREAEMAALLSKRRA